MESDQRIRIVDEMRLGDHLGAAVLLRRLEQQRHPPDDQITVPLQIQRRSKQCRHMRIVTAGMHHPLAVRMEPVCAVLGNGQTVDIGPQQHVDRIVGAADHADHTRFERRRHNFDAAPGQEFGQIGRRVVFLMRSFRPFVQMVAGLDRLVADFPPDVHGGTRLPAHNDISSLKKV